MIQAHNLTKAFKSHGKIHHSVKNVFLKIPKGSTLGLVGESGSGKSTLAKLLIRLLEPTDGSLFFHETNLTKLTKKELKPWRRKMQIIFQDPYSSLNPTMHVEELLSEPLKIHHLPGSPLELLRLVGLDKPHLHRYPHEFSGGQRQRIAIARSLAVQPEFLVCDEPLSALDMTTQQQILELFKEIKKQNQMTFLFISHDLLAVKQIADQIAVMKCGEIVEEGTTDQIFNLPQHPYTQKLISLC